MSTCLLHAAMPICAKQSTEAFVTGRSKRENLAALALAAPLRALLRRIGKWRGVLTFAYHRIGEPDGLPWDRSLWSARARVFDAQLEVLATECDVLHPSDILDGTTFAKRGRRVMITFDDGYKDNYTDAYPFLRKRRMTATFFITTGFIDERRLSWWDEIAWMVRHSQTDTLALPEHFGGPVRIDDADPQAAISVLTSRFKRLPTDETGSLLDLIAELSAVGRPPIAAGDELWMTWADIRDMCDHGMHIGGHTVSHPLLGRSSTERQEQEIAGCAQRIDEELGRQMCMFAYPVGSADAFNQATERLLRKHGVQLGFTLTGRLCSEPGHHLLSLDRVPVDYYHSARILHATTFLPSIFTRL
jgi:peptidoglycan/xylan/chitin deacetylase (PgdA/CDA1 family)